MTPTDDEWTNSSWTDDELVRCFDDAFEPWQKPGIQDGTRIIGAHGQPLTGWIPYWGWANGRTAELLGRDPIARQDYALTEVVHCGTRHEIGTGEAVGTCSSRYLNRKRQASRSRVVICVGSHAKEAFRVCLGIDLAELERREVHLWGPGELRGSDRYVVSVPHPGAFGHPKALEPSIGLKVLAQLRGIL